MTRSLHNYIDYIKALGPDALAEEMDALNNLLPVPYFVMSGRELAELERNAADFGEWKYGDYLQEETSSDGKQTYYVCLESLAIYAGEVYVTVHCKPDPANPDKPAHLAAKEEDIEWEQVDNFEIKTSADFKNYDDSIYWRLAEALECEEYEEDEEGENDE